MPAEEWKSCVYAAVFGIKKDESIEVYIPNDASETLQKILLELTERERLVLLEIYREMKTLQEVAELCDITRERIRQIETKALRKLRRPRIIRWMKLGNSLYENHVAEMQTAKVKTISDLEKFADTVPIEELELSARLYNCLKRKGISSLGDILLASPEELMTIRNLGRKTALELIEKLDENGINYAMINRGEFDEKTASFFGIEEEEWK